MIRRSTVVAIARAVNAVFFLTTSAYCILSYSSFAYYQFIRPEVFAWPGTFVALHHVFFWLMWFIAALTLAPYARGANGRPAWAACSYLVITAAVGVWLFRHHVLEDVDLSLRSLVAGLLWLIFPLSLALVDHLIAPNVEVRASSESRLFRACALAAIAVWVAYAIAAPYRLARTTGIDLSAMAVLIGLTASGLAHLMLFTGLYLVLGLVVNLARAANLGPRFEYWTLIASSGLALAFVLDVMAFTAVGFSGVAASISALALGLTIAAVWSGIARHRAADRVEELDAVDGFLAPIHVQSRGIRAILLVSLPFLAFGFAGAVEKLDWDFLLQKLSVLVLWILAFDLMYARSIGAAAGRRRAFLIAPVSVLAVFWIVSLGVPRLIAFTGDARLNPDFVLDRYAAVDPSFHFLQDVSRANSGDAVSFYSYLKANTTIFRDDIKPVDIEFVHPLGPPPAARPHIFLFIIDSLRRDYISAYNSRVTFTPAIDAFARESFVFDRAFTRYGATGLSVPAIWIGGMTLHMQYIRPFTPMNALMKLLDAGEYRRMMGIDTIAVRILDPTPRLTEIDRGVPVKQYDFCRTLDEMGEKLESVRTDPRPIFGYTLPQNLHIANSFETPVPPGESYPGFFERVAAQVHRLDGCFGRFIERLKTLGIYDNSIVILTADHGDSLGEDGRWGHSYTVFPEVMRVPLVIHLPASTASSVETDLNRVSFLTDITPTLYALLGYQPTDFGPLYGSPLFGRTPDESFRRRDPFLLAASYGAVYGLLRHNGRSLYIADAVEGRDYAYDLSDGGLGRRVEITEAMRALNWDLIRKEVGKIAAQYHFTPEP
jgi:Sulfatase